MTRIVRRTLLKTLSGISLGSLLPFMGHTYTIVNKKMKRAITKKLLGPKGLIMAGYMACNINKQL